MFQQLNEQSHDVLLGRSLTSERPGSTLIARKTSRDVVADRDVPLFALLRSARGLPLDDPRWWPAWPPQPSREASRPEGSRVERDLGVRKGFALPAGVSPRAQGIAHPTVDLLERTLAGLLAWDTAATAAVDSARPRGRHELTVAPALT